MKKGVSLISLIITIIVVIILAAIAIFSGFGTVEKANLAKFTQEFADYESAVQSEFFRIKQNSAIAGATMSDRLIYMQIAGTDEALQVPKELKKQIAGKVVYEIKVDSIAGIKTNKFGGTTYVSDVGEVFVLPAHQLISADGTIMKYASSSIKYSATATMADIAVGDWIEFDTTVSDVTLTIANERAGFESSASTYNPPLVIANTTTNWRVLKNNGDGTIDIVPGDKNWSYTLSLMSPTNAVSILNECAQAFANNSKYLSTAENGRALTESEWNQIYPQDPDTYKDIMTCQDPVAFRIYFWATEMPKTKGLRALKYDKKNGVFGSDFTIDGSRAANGAIFPIVTIGEGLEIDDSKTDRDGSTPERKWVLRIAE